MLLVQLRKKDVINILHALKERSDRLKELNSSGAVSELIKDTDELLKALLQTKELLESTTEKTVNDLNDIDTTTEEGKLLFAALAKITTESQKDKTPYEVIKQLNQLNREMKIQSSNDEEHKADVQRDYEEWLNTPKQLTQKEAKEMWKYDDHIEGLINYD